MSSPLESGPSKVDQVNEQFAAKTRQEEIVLAEEVEEVLSPEQQIAQYKSMNSAGLNFEKDLPHNQILLAQLERNPSYKVLPDFRKQERFRQALIQRAQAKLEQ